MRILRYRQAPAGVASVQVDRSRLSYTKCSVSAIAAAATLGELLRGSAKQLYSEQYHLQYQIERSLQHLNQSLLILLLNQLSSADLSAGYPRATAKEQKLKLLRVPKKR